MMKLAIGALAAGAVSLLAPQVSCARSPWIVIANTGDAIFEMQEDGAMQEVAEDTGVTYTTVIGRVTDRATQSKQTRKWSISTADCDRGSGKILVRDMKGALRFTYDFAMGSGQISNIIAARVCMS